MTDQDRLENVLHEHSVYSKALAKDLLELVIDIAGERLIAKEKNKAEIYRTILENKMVKPEFTKTIYKLMTEAEEHLK